MRPYSPALVLLTLLPSCSGEPAAITAAKATFAQFQDALLRQDRAAVAAVLTPQSRALLPRIPLHQARGKQPLVVADATYAPPEVVLSTRDPNENDKVGSFVIVKRDGRYCVDLVGTAGFAAQKKPGARGRMQITPRKLTASDLARARAVQAASPR